MAMPTMTMCTPKQSEARELITRLTKLSSELSNTCDLASNVADKVVGSRLESVGDDAPEALPSPNFLSELRAAISRLEGYPADINSHLNRIAQSF